MIPRAPRLFRMRFLPLPAALLAISAFTARAQSDSSQIDPYATPEVRRAVPVQRDDSATPDGTPVPVMRAEPVNATPAQAAPADGNNYQNPAWMDRLPVRRATAVQPSATPESEAPAATPVPVAKPIPVRTPEPVRIPRPTSPPPPAPTPVAPEAAASATPSTEEQMGLGTPVEAAPGMNGALIAANGFYRRKMYDMAVYEYEKYLIAEPSGKDRDGALFRLGESHRFMNNQQAARDAYQRLLTEFQTGEFVGAGAYRLGEIYYAEGNFPGALAMFQKAEANAKDPAVKLTAMYYQANTLDKMGRTPEAVDEFTKIAAIPQNNPYVDTANFYLAETAAKSGRKQQALAAYEKLADSAQDPATKAEATVKAGALAAELGNSAKAKELFTQALTLPAIGDWRSVVELGLMRLAYNSGDYKGALKFSDADLQTLSPDSLPDALLIEANAHRQLGQAKEALDLYDRIMHDYPQSDAAQQAQFQRLVCLQLTGSPEMGKQLDNFLAVSTDPRQRAEAMLLKAETLFGAGNYAAAAPLYAQVLKGVLPARLIPQARYKLGWCQLQLGQYTDAAQTFTLFIDQNPKSDLLPAALIQRAIAMQQSKAYDGALRDFDRIIRDYPKAHEREVALNQKALILGQMGKSDEMVKVFTQLLQEYPKTKAAGQAEYWLGSTAFEKKDYPTAIEHLEKARDLDAKDYAERATLRIVLAYYYQQKLDDVAREVANGSPEKMPAEVLIWLGQKYYDQGDYKKTEEFLGPIAARGSVAAANPDILLELSRALIAQHKWDEARGPVQQYLQQARDPLTRAEGLLASAQVSMGTGNYADASKLLDEAQLLQPEGHYNALGRLYAAEVMMHRGDYDGAAKAFMTIAVLYDDAEVTPKALTEAAEAYRKTGNESEAKKAIAERDSHYPAGGKRKTPDATEGSPTPSATPDSAPATLDTSAQ